jgi:hypothetical protein
MKTLVQRMATLTMVAGMMLFAAQADAIVLVTDCSWTCSSNCQLQNDLNCSGKTGIVLNSGADLEFAGHTLTCASNCPTAAVALGAGGSVVHNDAGNLSDVEGGIDGAFPIGVACNAKTGSTVRGIRVENTTVGLDNCAKVEQNVIIGSGANLTTGINTTGVANTDYIRDNYLDNWRFGIIVGSANSTDSTIEHNQIVVRDIAAGGGTSEIGVQFVPGLGGNIDLTHNAFYGDPAGGDMIAFLNGTVSFIGNWCDPTSTSCGLCKQSTWCESSITPFH